MLKKRIKVSIVGAGPGDWELISLKGLKRIRSADVILYDFLASPRLLKEVRRGAEIICVGKKDGLHVIEQRQLNNLLYQKAKAGKWVVRLKGGDPFLFSHGSEEALYLRRKGIAVEIIPGITSVFAAPESFGIPLTRKGKYSSVAVLTGRKSNSQALDAPKCDTLIYLMAAATIKKVVGRVLSSGRNKSTPCAFIERATTKDERIIPGTLETIERLAKRYALKPPAVFVVGEAVKYGKRLYGHKFKH